MINKRIFPAYQFRDHPTIQLLEVHSKGSNKQQMQKFASSDYLMSVDLRPEKGYSFVHLITTGSGEYYGPNNNGDWFNKTARDFTFPSPKDPHRKTITLDGGLEKYHNTFMKYGAVYREHNNSKKGGNKHGTIIAESINPAMHRGELIVKLANDEWADDLNKLASDGQVYFSMGCGVPYDTCSDCAHKAPTRNQYCEHLRYNKLGITKEGHQIFAINDKPHFHDISRVGVPADRIAFGLRKVASDGVLLEEEDVSGLYLPVSVIEKIGSSLESKRAKMLEKLSNIEKKIVVKGLSPDEEQLSEAFSDNELNDEEVKKMQGIPLDSLLSNLNGDNLMLPPKSFIRIVMGKPEAEIPGIGDMPCAVKDMYSDMGGEDISEVLSDGTYVPDQAQRSVSGKELTDSLAGKLSMEDEPVRKRIVIMSIKGKPSMKQANLAGSTVSAEARLLAKEYAKYQLSFLTSGQADKYAHLAVLHNAGQAR
jgi:hypothetical protein